MKSTYATIGKALDLAHGPLAFAVLIFGKLWMPATLHAVVVGTIIPLQVLCLGCPLNVLTCYLRRQEDPHYNYWGSVTFWLYHRYGRWIGIPMFAVCMTLSYLTARALLIHH